MTFPRQLTTVASVLADAGALDPTTETGLLAFVDSMMEQGWSADTMTLLVKNAMSAAGWDAPRAEIFWMTRPWQPEIPARKAFVNSILRTLDPGIRHRALGWEGEPPQGPQRSPTATEECTILDTLRLAFGAARSAMGMELNRYQRMRETHSAIMARARATGRLGAPTTAPEGMEP